MPPCTCAGSSNSKNPSKSKAAFWEAIIKKQEEKLDRLRNQKFEICSRIKELQAKCSPTFFSAQLKAIDAACNPQDKKPKEVTLCCKCSNESSESSDSSESNGCPCTPDSPQRELSLRCCSCKDSVESPVTANSCNCGNTRNPYEQTQKQYQCVLPEPKNCICTISEIKSSFDTLIANGTKTPPDLLASDATSCTCTLSPQQEISDNQVRNQNGQRIAKHQNDNESGIPCICGLCDLMTSKFPVNDDAKIAEELFTAKNFNRSNKKSNSKNDATKAYCCNCDKTVTKPPADVGDAPFKRAPVEYRQKSTSARPVTRVSATEKRKSKKDKKKSSKHCCYCGANLPPMEPNIKTLKSDKICDCCPIQCQNKVEPKVADFEKSIIEAVCKCDLGTMVTHDVEIEEKPSMSEKSCACEEISLPVEKEVDDSERSCECDINTFEKKSIGDVSHSCNCSIKSADHKEASIISCDCEQLPPPVENDGSCDCEITTFENKSIEDGSSNCTCIINAVEQEDVKSDATCSCDLNKPIVDVDNSCSCIIDTAEQENNLSDGTCSCGSLPGNQETKLQSKPVGDADSSCSCTGNNVGQENDLSDGTCSCGSLPGNHENTLENKPDGDAENSCNCSIKSETQESSLSGASCICDSLPANKEINLDEELKQGQDDVSSFVSCVCDLPQSEGNAQKLPEQATNKSIGKETLCSCGTQMKIEPASNKKDFSNKSTCIKICINSFTQTDEIASKGKNPIAFNEPKFKNDNCKCDDNLTQTNYEKEKQIATQSSAYSSSSSSEESSTGSSTSQSTIMCSCASKPNNSVSQDKARFISCNCNTVASTYVAALGLCGFNYDTKNKEPKTQRSRQFCSCSLDESEEISDDEQYTCVAIAIHSCNETPFKRSKNRALSTKMQACLENKGLIQKHTSPASKHTDNKTPSSNTTESKKSDFLRMCASKSTPSMGMIRKPKDSKIMCKNVSDIMLLAEDFKIFPNMSSESFTLSGSRNALSAIELSHDYAIPTMYVAVATTQNCISRRQKKCNQGCCVCLTLDSPSDIESFHPNASNIPFLSSFCFDSPIRRGTVDSGCSPIENTPFSKYCQTKHSSLRRHSSKSKKTKPTVSYAQTDSRCSVCSCSLQEAVEKELEDYGIVEDVPIIGCYHERKHKRKCVSNVAEQDSICDVNEQCSKKVIKRKHPTQDISRNRPPGYELKPTWYNRYDSKNKRMPSRSIDQELDNYPTKLDKILNIFGDNSKDFMDPSDSTASISVIF